MAPCPSPFPGFGSTKYDSVRGARRALTPNREFFRRPRQRMQLHIPCFHCRLSFALEWLQLVFCYEKRQALRVERTLG